MKLKPCPFCGDPLVEIGPDGMPEAIACSSGTFDPTEAFVVCSCGAQGPPTNYTFEQNVPPFRAMVQAGRRWNRRKP